MTSVRPDTSVPEVHDDTSLSYVSVCHPRGLAPCRCGRYFSEDFEGRLFCRGCEGTDAADITPRLPLCRRSK
jgi:hypothetical protein